MKANWPKRTSTDDFQCGNCLNDFFQFLIDRLKIRLICVPTAKDLINK